MKIVIAVRHREIGQQMIHRRFIPAFIQIADNIPTGLNIKLRIILFDEVKGDMIRHSPLIGFNVNLNIKALNFFDLQRFENVPILPEGRIHCPIGIDLKIDIPVGMFGIKVHKELSTAILMYRIKMMGVHPCRIGFGDNIPHAKTGIIITDISRNRRFVVILTPILTRNPHRFGKLIILFFNRNHHKNLLKVFLANSIRLAYNNVKNEL